MIGSKSKSPISEGSFSTPACGQHLLTSDQLAGGATLPPAPFIHNTSSFWSTALPWIGDIIGALCLFALLFFGLFLELIFS
jgi:hypothetical protein